MSESHDWSSPEAVPTLPASGGPAEQDLVVGGQKIYNTNPLTIGMAWA
jgi:hypothetical protein